ncbi:MAG TPA: hypothetical protein VFT58_01325, partial [Nitrososphaera sp.]|nr:hypothetical protein [Nitrososphaera sp.]
MVDTRYCGSNRKGMQVANAQHFSLHERVYGAEEPACSNAPAELPHIAGWDVGVRRSAADSGAGDFVDVFETPHGLGVVIGDVFGECMDAGLCTNLFRILLRAAENH